MPIVTVWPTPSGLPTASTTSPTRTASESPSVSVCRLVPSIFSDRQIARLIRADDLGLEAAAVGQLDVHLLGAVDDVVVGQDVAVGPDDDAGAQTAFTPLGHLPAAPALPELVAEELTQSFGKFLADVANAPLRANRHDGRRHLLDHSGIRSGRERRRRRRGGGCHWRRGGRRAEAVRGAPSDDRAGQQQSDRGAGRAPACPSGVRGSKSPCNSC